MSIQEALLLQKQRATNHLSLHNIAKNYLSLWVTFLSLTMWVYGFKWRSLGRSRSSKVTHFGTNRKPVCE